MIDQEQLNRLYRYALSVCHDSHQAFDLVQAAVSRFIEPPIPELEDPLPYLFRSIRNQAIDDYRKQQRHKKYIEQQQAVPVDFDVQLLEQTLIDQNQLQLLLEKASAEEREILYLWAVEGYTTQELADLMGMPKGTLLSKIYRFRQRIQAEFVDIKEARL